MYGHVMNWLTQCTFYTSVDALDVKRNLNAGVRKVWSDKEWIQKHHKQKNHKSAKLPWDVYMFQMQNA